MISLEEYRCAVLAMLEISDSLSAGWSVLNTPETPDNPCLELRRVSRLCSDGSESDLSQLSGMGGRVTTAGMVTTFTYHIIFNEAFSVPQLLFMATKTDGSQIPLAVLHKLVPTNLMSKESDAYLWETLTQVEHPILHRPFFALHPCRTAEMIVNMKTFSKNWLISWISSVGPAIGLHLPVGFATSVS